MYVIAKKHGDKFCFLTEVHFGSDLSFGSPSVSLRTCWELAELNELDYPYVPKLMYFDSKTQAYSFLLTLEFYGDETADLMVLNVEAVSGNE